MDKSVKHCQSEEEIKKCLNSNECLPKCEGILVASYFKTEKNYDQAEVLAPKLMEQYNNYKKFVRFPAEFRGIMLLWIMVVILIQVKLITILFIRLPMEKQTQSGPNLL